MVSVANATSTRFTSSDSDCMDLVPFIAEVFSRCVSCFSRWNKNSENPARWLGRRGEQLAARHLRSQRYKILYRNYRAPHGGEVDIVCRDKSSQTLVFIEVKTRRSTEFGSPASAVDLEKQKLIARGALAWLRLLNFPQIPFRFDIIEVIVDGDGFSFNIIQDAFQLPEPYIY